MSAKVRRVLCVAAPNWLGFSRFPRVLSGAGCHVSFLGHPRALTARSRFVDAVIPGSWDPDENIELLRARLAAGDAFDWILLADDPTVLAACRRCPEPWLAPWFPVDPASAKPALLASKAEFLAAAAASGVRVPAFRPASTPAEVLAAARALGFPVIVKPVDGSAGTGVRKVASEAELPGGPPPGAVIVQSFVAGAAGGTAVLYDHGRPVWWLSSLRTRVWPEPYGPSSCRTPVELPGVETMLTALGGATGLHGFCEFDWILPEDGSPPQVIELNPRVPAYLSAAERMGSDLSSALRAFLAGERPGAPRAPLARTPVGLFPEDLTRALAVRDWARCREWLEGTAGPVPWDDPRLFASFAWLVVKAVVRAALGIR